MRHFTDDLAKQEYDRFITFTINNKTQAPYNNYNSVTKLARLNTTKTNTQISEKHVSKVFQETEMGENMLNAITST